MDKEAKRMEEFRKIKEDYCIKFLSKFGSTFDRLSNVMDVMEFGTASKMLQQILYDFEAWYKSETLG